MSDETRPPSGGSEEWRNFEERHPTFRAALARLSEMLEAAFLRTLRSDDVAALANLR